MAEMKSSKKLLKRDVRDESEEPEEVDDEEVDDEEPGSPRKRGRPTNPNKVVREPSTRGRGRPRGDGVVIPPEEPRIKSTEKRGRGRPSKSGKRKHAPIVATGLGRGRPRKQVLTEQNGDSS